MNYIVSDQSILMSNCRRTPGSINCSGVQRHCSEGSWLSSRNCSREKRAIVINKIVYIIPLLYFLRDSLVVKYVGSEEGPTPTVNAATSTVYVVKAWSPIISKVAFPASI